MASRLVLNFLIVVIVLFSAAGARAQMPNPYGPPISLENAKKAAESALAEGLSNFTWSGSDLSGGLDGTTSGSTFAYWSVNAAVSPTQLATNIATAVNDNTTLQASTGVTAVSSGGVVTVTARATGTSGNSIGTTASLTGFAWGGSTLTGGATGRFCPSTSTC